MKYDIFGQCILTEQDAMDLLYKCPEYDLRSIKLENPDQYNSSLDQFEIDLPRLDQYTTPNSSIEEFDQLQQSNWFMPDSYKTFDIAQWTLEQCSCDAELQRTAQELLLYQDRNLFDLLRYLKYLVDIMRQNNIVWGVGRGSSVASFVLYKIGVHKINSLHYDLDIKEFLKD